MPECPGEMDGDSFAEMLDESSTEHCELADPGELMVSASKIAILQKEKLQLQQEMAQLWEQLHESKNQQAILENEVERKTEMTNALLFINQQSTEHLKNIRIHQNNLVDFIMDLEASRDEVVSVSKVLKNDYETTFQEFTEKIQQYQNQDNHHETEILKLKETIRQQDERIASVMAAHYKDKKLLGEANKQIETLNTDSTPKAELDALRSQLNQQQEAWTSERNQLMLAIENMREKFSADLMNERDNVMTITKVRHQEVLQFQKNLKVQLEKNSKLEQQIKTLESHLSAQKENVRPPTPKSARCKRQLTPSPCSDVESSDLSADRSFVEPIFKRKRFGFFANDADHCNTDIRDQFFCRAASSIPVDSTSGPTDVEEGCTRKTA